MHLARDIEEGSSTAAEQLVGLRLNEVDGDPGHVMAVRDSGEPEWIQDWGCAKGAVAASEPTAAVA
jgi:hypothetical protein